MALRASQPVRFKFPLTQTPTTLLSLYITQLKDSYNGILGMLWITHHGHLIDWMNQCFQRAQTAVASAQADLPGHPKTTPMGPPLEKARINGKGVCVLDTLTLPQRKFDISPSDILLGHTGKLDPPLKQ
jgi:hypothetical protein